MRCWPILLAPLLALAVLAPGASATPVAQDPQQAAVLGRVIQEPLRSTNYLQLTGKGGVEEFAPAFRLLQRLYPRYIRLSTVADELHDPLAVSTGKDGIAAGAPGDTHDGLPLYVITLTDRQVLARTKVFVTVTSPDGWAAGDAGRRHRGHPLPAARMPDRVARPTLHRGR